MSLKINNFLLFSQDHNENKRRRAKTNLNLPDTPKELDK